MGHVDVRTREVQPPGGRMKPKKTGSASQIQLFKSSLMLVSLAMCEGLMASLLSSRMQVE